MSEAIANQTVSSLSALLVPLADRTLLLPNVAVAELIAYRPPVVSAGLPPWLLGQIAWRDLQLPLLSFEAAAGGEVQTGPGVRVAVLNAMGGRDSVKFIALLVQGIPRSIKLEDNLQRADVELAPLELDAVQLGDTLVKIPDLAGLEQKLADAGLI